MRKTLIAGAVGLLMTSSVALADSYSSTVTTHSDPLNPNVVSTTRVDKSSTTEDGMLTQRTNIYHAPVVVQPTAQSTTTIERTTTTTSPAAE
ncbi:MAG TPA: hypothetical protein VL574_06485 [Stellaceae bacterium]|nr:hypothetical protein [Stellaceae bacterium]